MQALQGNTSDAVWALLCPVSPCTHRPAPGRSGTPQGHPKTSYLKVAEVEEGCRAVGEAQGHIGAAGELVGRCLGRRMEGAASRGGTLSRTLLTRIPPHGEPPKMGENPSNTRGRFPTQRGEGTPNRGGTQHEGTPNTRDVRGPQTLGGTQQGCEGTPNTQGGGTTAEMCGDQGHEGAPNTEGGQR